MRYYCSACKMAVIVTGGEVIKACRCDAPVVAEMEAQMEIKATVNDDD